MIENQSMDQYLLVLFLAGAASLAMAFMPMVTKFTGISYSLIYVALGAGIYLLWPGALPSPLPGRDNKLILHLCELIIIISLMGTGIKIDRRFSFGRWSSPLRLVLVAMVLCIALCTYLGMLMLELALPSALLLGAVLAPTDPVLASDVQVGPPNEGIKSETRFALTAEAGLNDGLAFPFTWLAIVLAGSGTSGEGLWNWLGYHLLLKMGVGLVMGWGSGKLAGLLFFKLAEKYRLIRPTDGFLAISLMLVVYGSTELLHGYGFIAVFVCGLTFRHSEKGHRYHSELHSFTDQIERLLLGILLIFFGGALVSGILAPLSWSMALFAGGFLLVVRPVSGLVSLVGTGIHWKEKLAIGFFGIRGMGSIYYLAFALGQVSFAPAGELWAIVSFTILLSVLMHGLTATAAIRHLKIHMPKKSIPS